MPQLRIDNRSIEVPAGTTILAAAQRLGIDIPTLCHLEHGSPQTACLVCVVKLGATGKLVPACATVAQEGMEVFSATEEVREARRTALELILSDHSGDCFAPCQRICPAHMDIPRMLRLIAQGATAEALAVVKQDIALPATLGYVCPAPCEKGCRRSDTGGAVAVCLLKRYVAEEDLRRDQPQLPPTAPHSGKRVAVIGAGPAGLAAAYHLAERGHGVTVFDKQAQAGGMLRYGTPAEELPRAVLDAEIAQIARLGVEFRLGVAIGREITAAQIQAEFDAVILACGDLPREQRGDLPAGANVFPAGGYVRPSRLAVRSLAEGKLAAAQVDALLHGRPAEVSAATFQIASGRLSPEECQEMLPRGQAGPRVQEVTIGGLSPLDAVTQAQRCVQCGCAKAESCKLRRYAGEYEADPDRFGREHPKLSVQVAPSPSGRGRIVLERNKCIACGLCLEVARRAGEPIGLTWLGRGFPMRPGAPLGHTLTEALTVAEDAVLAACPTGALTRLE